MRKVTKEGLEKSFQSLIKEKGITDKALIDMIQQYLDLYEIKEQLRADVKKRGTNYVEVNTKGEPIVKDNKSIEKILKVNAQMLKILDYLGIKPSDVQPIEDDEL